MAQGENRRQRTYLELKLHTVSLVSNLLAPITSNVQTNSCSESQRNREKQRAAVKKEMIATYHFISAVHSMVFGMHSNIFVPVYHFPAVLITKWLHSGRQIKTCGGK